MTKTFSVEGGGLKTETDNFLRHFLNSKASNRCRSVYGTDIIIGPEKSPVHFMVSSLGFPVLKPGRFQVWVQHIDIFNI